MEPSFTHSNGINIPHFSASTINSFIKSRYGFYKSKVESSPFKGNQYTARGQAVEHGVNTWIEKPDSPNLLEITYAKFDEECKKSGVSKIEAEEVRDTIHGLLDVALGYYKKEFADGSALTQQKIELNLEGVSRTLIGYLDFYRPGKKVNDSKVVSRTPGKLSQDYILQGSLYRKATGCAVQFDYFVANKKPVHAPLILTDDEYIHGISYLTRAAQVLEELEECEDPKRILKLMSFPNLDEMWTYSEKKAAADDWGIIMK